MCVFSALCWAPEGGILVHGPLHLEVKMQDIGYTFNSPKYELVISDGDPILSCFYTVPY